jgi:hypothetical protein
MLQIKLKDFGNHANGWQQVLLRAKGYDDPPFSLNEHFIHKLIARSC